METTAIGQADGQNHESSKSGIHWASILAGAVAAAAISLILLPLGTALGFGSFSVLNLSTGDALALSAGAAIWLVIMQWISSGIGGYIAGRLRVKWADMHSDEVFFRDTAHGFLAWGVSTIVTVSILAAITASTAGSAIDAGSNVASNVATGASPDNELSYFVDSLYRTNSSMAELPPAVTVETTRILGHAVVNGSLSADDKVYLAHRVALRTGLSDAEAQARIATVMSQIEAAKQKATQAAEAARKTLVTMSTLLCLSLVIGAFIASVSAALGGRLRDTF